MEMCGNSTHPGQTPEPVGFNEESGRTPGLQERCKGQGLMDELACSLETPPINGITIVLRVILSGQQLVVEGKEGVAEGGEGEGQVEEVETVDVVGGAVAPDRPLESDMSVHSTQILKFCISIILF